MDRLLSTGVLGLGIGLGLHLAIQAGAGAQQPASPPAQTGQAQPAQTQAPPAGRGRGMAFTEPSPMDFNDHEGYVSLFDGVSLKGWDGNPKFWRVENGAIVGESTPANPSGNSYIVYRERRGEGLHAEVRDQGRGHRRQRHSVPQPDGAAVAGQHFPGGDGQRRPGQPQLDDDRSAGGLLAEPRLHRAVLFREHADAHPRLARTGRRGLRRDRANG